MTHQFDLVVHSFEGSIGDSQFSPGQKSWEMLFYQACKFDKRLQPRVSGPPEPLFEVGLGSFFLEVIPKPLEFLFEIVSPDDRKVEFKQMREPSAFLGGEIPRILQQDEPSLFEIDSLLMSQPFDFCPSDLVKGPIQVLDDMEAIENQGGLRRMVLNRSQIRSPHIQTDGLKRSGSSFSEPSEELIDRLLFSVHSYPQKFSSFRIIDQGEIAMPLLARNLIDAKEVQGLDLPQLQPFLHHSFHDRGNHFPIQSKGLSHFLEGQSFCQQSNGLSQGLGDPFPSSRPGHLLDSQPPSRAEYSKGRVEDLERLVSERKISRASFRTSSPGEVRFSPTMATFQTMIPQTIDSCHPPFFGLEYLGHPMGFHFQAFSDISFHTHRPLTPFPLTSKFHKRSSIRVSDAFPLFTYPNFS